MSFWGKLPEFLKKSEFFVLSFSQNAQKNKPDVHAQITIFLDAPSAKEAITVTTAAYGGTKSSQTLRDAIAVICRTNPIC